MRVRIHAASVIFALFVGGCTQPTAKVTGKVTTGGKEVTSGGIILSPVAVEGNNVPGRPGVADIRSDGTYSMVIEAGPNGLAERFNVRFALPSLTFKTEEEAMNAVIPYFGLAPKETTVEIKPGDNVINVELVPKTSS